ncbi:hypothetical protein D0X99_10930 [Algoriphagus lacus]|uniref:Uncharacterized protein n=1 Tax=Algoriphagus lacus TaxID=2056311 RepID=A0A418PQR8_9BACT|nr:hypothetical protein [Algoriphagus lacus]RIW14964.1 hypothetical protein D0X99_10930 [Algoriphagus lacus]
MKYVTILFLCFFFHLKTTGQALKDPIHFKYTSLHLTNPESGSGHLDVNCLETNFEVPITLGKKIKLINAFYSRFSDFGFSPDFNNHFFSKNLHDTRCSASVRAGIPERQELIAIAGIMARSDLRNSIDAKVLFPFGLFLMNYAIGENSDFTFGFGVALVSDFYHDSILPIASLNFETERVDLKIVYPNVNILFKESELFGWSAKVEGAISRVSEQSIGVNDDPVEFQRNIQSLVATRGSRRTYNQVF